MRISASGRRLSRLAPLLRAPRFEVFPSPAIEAAVAEHVPREVTITVTASPARGLGPTIDLAERLAARGYRVVPHLSARLVADDAQLKDIVARLTGCGVDDVFVPAGDADPPAGRFDSALGLLDALAAMGRPFSRVGVTGYPQSHPLIADDITIQAMWDKRHHASYLVSNLCLNPRVLRAWIARVRSRGVALPLYVGLSGPVDRARLLRMAAVAGVAESRRFAAGHAEWFLRMGTPQGYRPERLLDRLAGPLTDPGSRVEGLHIFTFNQVRRAGRGRRADRRAATADRRPARGDHPRPATAAGRPDRRGDRADQQPGTGGTGRRRDGSGSWSRRDAGPAALRGAGRGRPVRRHRAGLCLPGASAARPARRDGQAAAHARQRSGRPGKVRPGPGADTRVPGASDRRGRRAARPDRRRPGPGAARPGTDLPGADRCRAAGDLGQQGTGSGAQVTGIPCGAAVPSVRRVPPGQVISVTANPPPSSRRRGSMLR